MFRTVIVDGNSPILKNATTHILFHYANGQALVETEAPAVEAVGGKPSEETVKQGVALPELTAAVLETAREKLNAVPADQRIAAYVELRGPAEAPMLATLKQHGVLVQQYVPDNAYLCYGTGSAFHSLEALPFVAAVLPVDSSLKGSPKVSETGSTDVYIVAAAALADPAALSRDLAKVPGVTVKGDPDMVGGFISIPATINSDGATAVLSDSRVLRVEPRPPKKVEDEVADLILVGDYDATGKPQGSYVTWMDDHGVNGSGLTIGIVDAGVDVTHPAFTGRAVDLNSGNQSWHGTGVAGHAVGCYLDHKDPNGFIYGLGIAPSASMISQDNQKAAGALCNETATTKSPSGVAGSIQNNSWGAGTQDPMDYSSQEAAYDALVRDATGGSGTATPLTICFSAGNDGTAGLTRPKAAKNLIITGNSENYRPDVGGADADNIQEIYSGAHASSHGNCGDGRIRPLVTAPGEWTASANYDSHPGEQEYIDDKLTWLGGTSGASPKTAGGCALLTQWWRNHDSNNSPSPAMLRALVVNGAEPITAGGALPNMIQGWGRLNLDNIVRDDVHRTYLDQSILLNSRGDSRSWTIRPSDPKQPIYITLAWTDPPGAPGSGTKTAPAVVNKLALRVNTNGQLYRGNQFRGGWSTPDTGTDREGWDNNQCVFLRNTDLGDTLDVSVTALELGMNCLTNAADTPQQDFALVIRNGFVDQGATPANVFLVVDTGAAASSETSNGNHWKQGSSDQKEVSNPITARPTGTASTNISSISGSSGTSSDNNSDAWWNAGNGSQTETSKAATIPASVVAGATVGSSLARSNDATITMPGGDPSSPVADLAQALAAINAAWQKIRADRRRVGVIVVGDDTRVSNDDVASLRRLSFHGELFVLSLTRSILAFLAQRVHRCTGVSYRLYQNPNELARGVRDALAEASGMQHLVTDIETSADGTTLAQFDVVTADKAFTCHVQYAPGGVYRLQLAAPGQAAREVYPGKLANVATTDGNGWIELRVTANTAGPAWAGRWTLSAAPAAGAKGGIAIDVFAQTALRPRQNHETSSDGIFVTVEAGKSANMGGLSGTPNLVNNDPAVVEASRLINISVHTSRLDAGGKAGEAPKSALAPSIGAVIRARRSNTGAQVIDFPAESSGADADGKPFRRKIRHTIVDLEPRSSWRRRMRPAVNILTAATVVSLSKNADRSLVSLTLQRNGKRRKVKVDDPVLKKLLAGIDLTGNNFYFQVAGDQLISVFHSLGGIPLSTAASDGSGEVGALGATDPAVAAEDTKDQPDYPQASRFVPARYFTKSSGTRTVDEVVIHITDGGKSIDGTIQWFQNDKVVGKASAHYIVGQNGEVVQMVHDNDVANHANAANPNSIGIEHVARAKGALGPSDAGLAPTQVQYAASTALVQYLCKKYNLPLDRTHILGHREADLNTTHQGCPDAQWDWTYYMGVLTAPVPQGSSDAGSADAGTTDTSTTGEGTGDAGTGSGTTDSGTGAAPVTSPDTGTGPSGGPDEQPSDAGAPAGTPASEDVKASMIAAPSVIAMPVAVTRTVLPTRPIVSPIATSVDGAVLRNRFVMRPTFNIGMVPFIPWIPAPTLGDPVTAGSFALWPDPPRQQAFFAQVSPETRRVSLTVQKGTVAAEGGGTTSAITGGSAVLTVSVYADAAPSEITAYQQVWIHALKDVGTDASKWRFEPLGLRDLTGTLNLGASRGVPDPTSVSAIDAGTVTFMLPLNATEATNWLERFQTSTAARITGVCTLNASYLARLGMQVDVRQRVLTAELGTLLAKASPADVNVVNPQVSVESRIIVTAHELVDSVVVDVVPSEGHVPQEFAFSKEGGQSSLTVTSEDISKVTLDYTATVRYTPPGWTIVQEKGKLKFGDADWSIWVKPDSWILNYTIIAIVLDDQNRVLSDTNVDPQNMVTATLDYRLASLGAPLSLSFQTSSQQIVKVPFPAPPGSGTPTLRLSVVATRTGTSLNLKARDMKVTENMIVVKIYSNGAIDIVTNEDKTTELSIESEALGLLAKLA